MKDINLLPEEIKETEYVQPNKSNGFSFMLLFGLIIGIAIIAVTILAPYAYIWQKEKELEAIEAEIESEKYDIVREVNSDLDEINGIIDGKMTVINTIDGMSHPVNEIIVALQSIVPEGAVITNIRYNNNKIDVTGIAADRITVAEMIASVNRISLLTLSSELRVDEANVFQFSVNVGSGRRR
ncbi:UNVERIFIED_CONTAM: Tfp pilus assembly protein PilN [Acetivibrio alkalicellulosi]